MFRIALFALITVECAFSQGLPAYVWGKQLDGSGSDHLTGMGTDAVGNVYIVGYTNSTNFPVKAAVQNHLATSVGTNVFVTELDPSGNIVYSTYFGRSKSDTASAMAVDASGNVYVTGYTTSLDFPTTPGVYSYSPPGDFVVAVTMQVNRVSSQAGLALSVAQ